MDTEHRAQLSSAEINDLPDSAFAYIEPGGSKDDGGKTTPRKLRHYPVHDKPHADDAAARAGAALKGDDADAKAIAGKALPKIKAAQAKFAKQSNSTDPAAEDRDDPTAEDWSVGYGLKNLKGDLARVKADQLADPDNKIDPDDEAVMAAIEEAEAAIDKAITAQGKDTKREPAPRSSNPATPKRAFSSLVEQAPARTVDLEIRMDEGADPHIANFTGYAYTIDERYGVKDWLGEYGERIGPGASSKTLKEQRSIPLLLNHDGLPMANTQSKTSQLADDGHGLRNLALFDRRSGTTNDVCIALQRGDIDKMSFSFRAVVDEWNEAYDDRLVRELQLFDTSIVTYPANPGTSAELVDAMRSALGREGRSLWLADSELSVRSALPVFVRARDGGAAPDNAGDLLERAVRALAHADEIVCRSLGRQHGRARTFLVAQAMLELRAGKALSAKNEGLLQTALSALASADKQHAKLSASHATAHDAVSNVLNAASGDGKDGNQGATTGGNSIAPQDGAGPRSAALKLQRQREAELRALRNRRP